MGPAASVSETGSIPDTTPSSRFPRRLMPRHLAWLSVVFCAAGLATTVLFAAIGNQGSSPTDALLVVGTLAYPIVGAILVARLPRNLVGWLLCAVGIAVSLMLVAAGYGQYATQHPGSLPWALPVAWVSGWTYIPTLVLLWLIPFFFPDGRVLSPRWRIVLVTAALFAVLSFLGNAFAPGPISQGQINAPNPYAVHAPQQVFSLLLTGSGICFLVTTLGVVASVVVRYRRADRTARQQIKWFTFAAVLLPVPFVLHDTIPDLSNVTFGVLIPLLPIAIGVAILRHGLYEIDVVINKALVYASLAVIVAVVYVALVIGVGSLVSGAGRFNLVLSIGATAVLALAFQPLRSVLQRGANRLVYGKRALPYDVLAEFTQQLGQSYALDSVLPRMVQALGEGTNALRAEVWIKVGDSLRRTAVWPVADEPSEIRVSGDTLPALPDVDRAAPVVHQDELLGALTVKKPRSEPLSAVEEKLLDDLAHQAGLVLKNVGLTAELMRRLDELQASRQRLVSAQDEERRKIERNLHDGAQQQLVGLKVKLGLARALALKDPQRTYDLLEQLVGEADESVQTLRDLAHGIYPPLLADQGLKAALDSQARKSVIDTSVEAEGLRRHQPDAEAAIYFCCLEAMQNAVKYSHANHVALALRETGDRLEFSVSDDGHGYDADSVRPGAGLQNMIDRLEALGGRLSVESKLGEGTTIRGWLPVQPAAASLRAS